MVRITTGLFVSFVLLAVAAIAHAEEQDGGRAAYQTASKYFEAEEYEAALPYFRQAYDRSGRRPATIFGLAQCLRSLKRYDDAIALFKDYLATDPDNAAEVRETLGLLEEIAERRRTAKAEERKKRESREAEEARQNAEEKRRREAEREAAAREAEERARAAAEAAIAAKPAPPPPPPAVTAAPPEEDDGGIASSPVFWIVTGAAVVGGAIAVAMLATGGDDPYGGSTGVVLSPLGGGR